MDLTKLPILQGAFLTFCSDGDIRKELSLGILVLIGVLLVVGALGFRADNIENSLISAFALILGYWFGQKETEQRCAI